MNYTFARLMAHLNCAKADRTFPAGYGVREVKGHTNEKSYRFIRIIDLYDASTVVEYHPADYDSTVCYVRGPMIGTAFKMATVEDIYKYWDELIGKARA